jgi:ketosteroid isomerase-like protein
MSNHIETVSKIYDAFGKGDIPTLLTYLADDVQWEAWADNTAQKAGVPWLQSKKGKAGAMDFFQVVSGMNITNFEVKSLMGGPDQVAAELVISADIPATGGHFTDEEVHLWKFNAAGQVVRMRHYTDTAKHMQAAMVEKVH